MHKIQIREQCSIKLVLCPTIAVPSQQIPTTAHIHRTHTAWVSRHFTHSCGFQFTYDSLYGIFSYVYLPVYLCATHFMSPYFFHSFFFIIISLFMCKRIYLSGLCSYIVELNIFLFCVAAVRDRDSKRENEGKCIWKGFAFDTNEYIQIQVCFIDLIIFRILLFQCKFLCCSHRFFMIKYGKQSVASKLWQRDSQKNANFLKQNRELCAIIFWQAVVPIHKASDFAVAA